MTASGGAWTIRGYALGMGFLFAFLQTGYFFQLQFRLTAAYPTFLTVTVAWLLGSVAGVWLGGRRAVEREAPPSPDGRKEEKSDGKRRVGGFAERILWLAASLAAYYLSLVLLRWYPYRIELLPALGALIGVSGIQAGHFFGISRSLFRSSGQLFFWENNGFVLGWIAAFAGYVGFGSPFHWVAPALAGVVAAGLREGRRVRPYEGRGMPAREHEARTWTTSRAEIAATAVRDSPDSDTRRHRGAPRRRRSRGKEE